uniref:Integrator complex subunit 2 n=1 Tax=Anthurium amnicola TaxID=1678845 RepID=A0A1D1YRC9_9ARAE
MESSACSSMSKAFSRSGGAASSSEESGWTEYFDYFMASEKGETTGSRPSDDGSEAADGLSSLVSDAASCVLAWSASPTRKVALPKSCKNLKRRTRLEDDSLEDTASSPVSSPKVNNMNKFDHVNQREKDDERSLSQVKGVSSGSRFETKGHGMDEMDFVGRARECVELKKKGLCLVPLSMLVDYLE